MLKKINNLGNDNPLSYLKESHGVWCACASDNVIKIKGKEIELSNLLKGHDNIFCVFESTNKYEVISVIKCILLSSKGCWRVRHNRKDWKDSYKVTNGKFTMSEKAIEDTMKIILERHT